MAELSTIARPYAEAVFALADKANALGPWSETLDRLAAVSRAPEMSNLLGKPGVSDAQVVELFAAVAGEMPREARQLLAVLAENKRLTVLPEVASLFDALKAEREGAVEAQIASAFPLEGGELAALVSDLARRFKRKVRPQVSVDPELIGGARIQVGDQVIDGSVRSKLEAMRIGLTG